MYLVKLFYVNRYLCQHKKINKINKNTVFFLKNDYRERHETELQGILLSAPRAIQAIQEVTRPLK